MRDNANPCGNPYFRSQGEEHQPPTPASGSNPTEETEIGGCNPIVRFHHWASFFVKIIEILNSFCLFSPMSGTSLVRAGQKHSFRGRTCESCWFHMGAIPASIMSCTIVVALFAQAAVIVHFANWRELLHMPVFSVIHPHGPKVINLCHMDHCTVGGCLANRKMMHLGQPSEDER